jgi:hypothetical protein
MCEVNPLEHVETDGFCRTIELREELERSKANLECENGFCSLGLRPVPITGLPKDVTYIDVAYDED